MNMSHICPICCNKTIVRSSSFTRFCEKCNYWSGDLLVNINSTSSECKKQEVNDELYISALDSLRQQNFKVIIDEINKQTNSNHLSILDVGCASGSFMKYAISRGHKIKGVEPNKTLSEIAKKEGLCVVEDFFPPRKNLQEKFDLIIFNDVFEHIPDINNILSECKSYLNSDGFLLLNVPNSDGLIFRISKQLVKINIQAPWKRLWQVMFKTPHLHYFNHNSLNKLLIKNNFTPVSGKVELPTIVIKGAWSRLRIEKSILGIFKNVFLYISFIMMYPIIKYAEKDTFFIIYKISK